MAQVAVAKHYVMSEYICDDEVTPALENSRRRRLSCRCWSVWWSYRGWCQVVIVSPADLGAVGRQFGVDGRFAARKIWPTAPTPDTREPAVFNSVPTLAGQYWSCSAIFPFARKNNSLTTSKETPARSILAKRNARAVAINALLFDQYRLVATIRLLRLRLWNEGHLSQGRHVWRSVR